MKLWKTAALVVALIGAAGIGALLPPIAHGQSTTRTAPRALEVISGRGSQIGVSVRDVDEEDVKAGKLTGQAGVLIEEVTPESPAEKAGLKQGDVVVDYDGERVRSVRQFIRLVQETPPGRKVQATVARNGQKSSVTLEPRQNDGVRVFGDLGRLRDLEDLGRNFAFDLPTPPARPSRPAPPTPPKPPAFPDFESFIWRSGNSLGITTADLSPQLAEYFGAKDGVLVTSVANDSAAARAGVKAGDVITALNGSTVDSPSELRRRIQRLESGDEFTLDVVRDKKSTTVKGKIDERRDRRRTLRSVV
jgi:serine protease Do